MRDAEPGVRGWAALPSLASGPHPLRVLCLCHWNYFLPKDQHVLSFLRAGSAAAGGWNSGCRAPRVRGLTAGEPWLSIPAEMLCTHPGQRALPTVPCLASRSWHIRVARAAGQGTGRSPGGSPAPGSAAMGHGSASLCGVPWQWGCPRKPVSLVSPSSDVRLIRF